MSGFDRRRNLRMGLAWSQSIRKGLVATSLLKRATLIWFSPPATSPNRVAPSFLKVDRHLISADSVKIKWAQGNMENVCPPSG